MMPGCVSLRLEKMAGVAGRFETSGASWRGRIGGMSSRFEVIQHLPPWVRQHPWLSGSVAAIGACLLLVGIPGVISDTTTWLSWIVSDWAQKTFVILGFLMILCCLFVPVIWGAFGLPNPFSRNMPVDIQLKSGSGFPPSRRGAMAQLLILNRGNVPLEKCAIRVVNAIPIREGTINRSPQWWPSVLEDRNEAFQLRWSNDEMASYGETKQWLDLPSDGSWHSADVAEYGSDPACSVAFCPSNRHSVNPIYPESGWWKLEIRIACEAGWYKPKEIALVFGFQPREGIPGPILLDWWEPRGQRVLDNQLENRKKEQQQAIEEAMNQENKIDGPQTSGE